MQFSTVTENFNEENSLIEYEYLMDREKYSKHKICRYHSIIIHGVFIGNSCCFQESCRHRVSSVLDNFFSPLTRFLSKFSVSRKEEALGAREMKTPELELVWY